MSDYGLDLAVIGNGRTAALLDPASRIVWWCFPRYDSDPVFCRLLAGDEEKGFTTAAKTDSEGRFVLRNLAPGRYGLTVSAPGMRTYTQAGITLNVGQNAEAGVRLAMILNDAAKSNP